jgi:hypothetical protein
VGDQIKYLERQNYNKTNQSIPMRDLKKNFGPIKLNEKN